MVIGFFVFVIIAALLLALLEIQIEGAHGWAKDLPTWTRHVSLGPLKFSVKGYHLYLFLFVFFLLQFRFVFQPFTVKDELFSMSAYTFMVIFEDILWFALNPAYGLKKYNKQGVPWFQSWWLGFPSFYFFVLPLAAALLVAGLSM